MFKRNTLRTHIAAAVGFVGLSALAIFITFALVTKQFIGIPIALLMLLSWGGMFVLQFVLPVVAILHIAMWVNRKFCARA
jgi:hypothetical protein